MNLFDVVRRRGSGASQADDHCGVQRNSSVRCASDPHVHGFCLEHYTLDEFIKYLESRRQRVDAFDRLLSMYRITRTFPDMSNFRLGPNMFEKIPADWIFLSRTSESSGGAQLVAHGIAARVPWNGNPSDLPKGWQGTVRYCYENLVTYKQRCNTLVGLFIKVEDESREQGWAGYVVGAMKDLGSRCGLSRLIIPLRLPTRYQEPYAAMPFEEFAYLKRDDGEYRDHWLRLHVRLGAQIIGHCTTSHQHAMNLDDFYQQFESKRCETSGDHLVKRNGEWYHAYVDLERDCAVINEGCVWVQHSLGGS